MVQEAYYDSNTIIQVETLGNKLRVSAISSKISGQNHMAEELKTMRISCKIRDGMIQLETELHHGGSEYIHDRMETLYGLLVHCFDVRLKHKFDDLFQGIETAV